VKEQFEGNVTMVHDEEAPPELLFSGDIGIGLR
jgi:hypothetical protein